MAGDRQKSGYIWGPDHLDFANKEHYDRAMNSNDIQHEEYWYQSVLHGPGHARVLSMEIFQKKRRNKVTNKVGQETIVSDSDSDVVNSLRSREVKNDVRYTRVSEDHKLNEKVYLPDAQVKVINLVNDIASECNPDQLKIFGFLIVKESLDQLLFEDHKTSDFGELGKIVEDIWANNVSDINALNKFVGTKYRAENARKSLSALVKNKFPLLLVKI